MTPDAVLPVITGTVGMLAGGVTSYVALRKDRREARSQVTAEAEATISLLKDQNEVLHNMLAASEAREAEALKREDRLDARVAELERDHRRLLLSITSMGLCTKASTCPEYSPAERQTLLGMPGLPR